MLLQKCRAVILFGLLPAFCFSLEANAQQSDKAPKWGDVGGWAIHVDRSVGNGCFAMQVYDDNTVVRIGVDVEKKSIYLLFANDAWKSIEKGKIYPVRVVFDGVSTFQGEMQGHRLEGGAITLAHRNLSTDFVKDFMQRNTMRLYYQGNQIAALSLRNTYAAVSEVINCQKELGFGSSSPREREPSDPFLSGGGGNKRDPFR